MEKFIRPVFTLELNYKIVPGIVTIGKYDGTHPCITAATTSDKVLIHSPHRRNAIAAGRIVYSESNREIATLNINQKITSLTTGPFLQNDDKDVLIIGTDTHILVYHVHDNKDVFYKECPDGVKSVCLGQFRDSKTSSVFVGGNSSVHCYDCEGNEIFWTAVGDTVTALLLMDYDKDGLNELIVSSEDFNIRVFKGDNVVAEFTETEVVTGLLSLPDNRFAYSVSNGTIGVYEQNVRIWRVKSKNFAIDMQCYDLLGQSSLQLITGWSNGKIDCRSIVTGEVLFKDNMSSGCAGVVEGDYRSVGKTDIVCISAEGEVRGYTTTKSLTTAPGAGSEQDQVRQLLVQKQSLLMELRHYQNNAKYNENAGDQTESFESHGVIPASTRVQIGISTGDSTSKKNFVEIFISTNNSTIIKAIILFAEGIFKGETHVIHPPQNKLRSDLTVPLLIPKDHPVDIHIKALVGYPNSVQFHVFEITRQLPRFAMYSVVENVENKSTSYVQFRVSERLQRICIWLNQNFLLPDEYELDGAMNIVLPLKCLRDSKSLILIFETTGNVIFYTYNMALAADLIQSLAIFLKLESLQCAASFVDDERELKELMEKLTEIQDARMKLGTDVADRLGQIRTLIIKAEDSRINDMKELPSLYNELNILNKELINGYNIRLTNYNEGLETMKKINSIIQKASRLRVGPRSADVINFCRNAIKNNNIDGLIKIIRTGEL